jgi:hypothetical protein
VEQRSERVEDLSDSFRWRCLQLWSSRRKVVHFGIGLFRI